MERKKVVEKRRWKGMTNKNVFKNLEKKKKYDEKKKKIKKEEKKKNDEKK